MTSAICCEPDPVTRLAPLLGPRVGLRARRPISAALRVPIPFTMPLNGTKLVTFTAGAKPEWNMEALLRMGLAVELLRDDPVATEGPLSTPGTPGELRKLEGVTYRWEPEWRRPSDPKEEDAPP